MALQASAHPQSEASRLETFKKFPPTEYQYEYMRYGHFDRSKPIVPQYSPSPAFMMSTPGNGKPKTENGERYVEHPLPAKFVREKPQYKPSKAKMSQESVHKADFKPWWTYDRMLPIRHPCAGPTLLYHAHDPTLSPSDTLNTTQRSDYQTWSLASSKRDPIRPVHTRQSFGETRTPTSNYKRDFGTWDVNGIRREMKETLKGQACRVKGPPTVGETGVNGGVGEYVTTMRKDFVAFPDDGTHVVKPKGKGKHATSINLSSSLPRAFFSPPFMGSTVYRVDYTSIPDDWNGASKSLKPIRKWENECEDRDFLSETMVSYHTPKE